MKNFLKRHDLGMLSAEVNSADWRRAAHTWSNLQWENVVGWCESPLVCFEKDEWCRGWELVSMWDGCVGCFREVRFLFCVWKQPTSGSRLRGWHGWPGMIRRWPGLFSELHILEVMKHVSKRKSLPHLGNWFWTVVSGAATLRLHGTYLRSPKSEYGVRSERVSSGARSSRKGWKSADSLFLGLCKFEDNEKCHKIGLGWNQS